MEKLVDLHTHTYYSDGTDSPYGLLKKARKLLSIIAITDHDTIEGLKVLSKADMNSPGLRVIPGIEISAKIDKGQLHILGLGIDIYNKTLNVVLEELKALSISRFKKMIAYLDNEHRIIFPEKELQLLYNSKGNIGRPHISHLLIKYGYVANNDEAFGRYLIEAYDSVRHLNLEIPPEKAIKLILEASGLPVLAHPNTLKKDLIEFRKFIKLLKHCGLQGIEAFNSSHSPKEMNDYNQIAVDYELSVTGGTDYHGGTIIKSDVRLGTGKNNNICLREHDLPVLKKIR